MSWEGYYHDTRNGDYISQTVAADGTAGGHIGPCPEGFCWYVERLTCFQSGAAVATTAVLEFYVQSSNARPIDTSKQNRQDVALGTTVANGVSQELPPIYVGPGQMLKAVWTGLTSGDLVRVSSQIRVHKLIAPEARSHHHQMEYGGDAKAETIHGTGEPPIAEPVVTPDQVAAV